MAGTVLSEQETNELEAPSGPPPREGLLREIGAVLEPARLSLKLPSLLRAPRGDGRITLLLPGWRTSELAMAPIGRYLGRLGHDTRGWGLGVNDDDVEETRDRMIAIVDALIADGDRPVNLVGWSLGGVIAREIARFRPDAVHRLVTYGTPAIGGPTHTIGAFSMGRAECERISALQIHLDSTQPIPVPITAFFTRNDGAVDWRACIDRSSQDVTMIEVASTHIGLGLDPDVWLGAAEALAEPS